MKLFAFFCLSVVCLLGIGTAQQYGGYPGYPSSGMNSYMGIGAAMFALLFLILILNNSTKSVPLYFGNESLGVNVNVG